MKLVSVPADIMTAVVGKLKRMPWDEVTSIMNALQENMKPIEEESADKPEGVVLRGPGLMKRNANLKEIIPPPQRKSEESE